MKAKFKKTQARTVEAARRDPIADLMPAISATMNCVEVAIEELNAAKLPKEIDKALFTHLQPPKPFAGKSLDVYRSHVRELIGRAKVGAPLEPATDAELAALFSESSLVAPLTRSAAAAYAKVFARVMPKEAKQLEHLEKGAGASISEAYPGQVEETLAQLRRKFRTESRKLQVG